MAVRCFFRALYGDKRGEAAVEFIAATAMLILIFAVLLGALCYVTAFYNASFTLRRVVRAIEIAGEYNEESIDSLAEGLAGGLSGLKVSVPSAEYISGTRHIQLNKGFTVSLEAKYPVCLDFMGSAPVSLDLPIKISMRGRSERYWK
ncbi:MAG: DUF4320 family protein [Oscillospiraceae bacterium]|nr:DUF4320 family protein [Oscillospiraceae bacterium]MBQ9898468.1 DUF4320 family protein [Ruminococcus sp.]